MVFNCSASDDWQGKSGHDPSQAQNVSQV